MIRNNVYTYPTLFDLGSSQTYSKFIKASVFLLKVATLRIFSWDGPNIQTSTKIMGPSRSHQSDRFDFTRKPKALRKTLHCFTPLFACVLSILPLTIGGSFFRSMRFFTTMCLFCSNTTGAMGPCQGAQAMHGILFEKIPADASPNHHLKLGELPA